MTLANWMLTILTAASFALSLPFNKLLIADFTPLTLAALRALLAFPAVCLLAWTFRVGLPRGWEQWSLATLGAVLLIAVPFSAIAYGQQYIPSGLGGVLYGTMPLMTVAIASLLLPDEPLGSRKLFGCVVGLAGVVLVVGPAALQGVSAYLLGLLGTLVAPLAYALGTVLLRGRPPLHPITLTAGMLLVASLLLVPLALVTEAPPPAEALVHRLWPLLGLAILGTAAPALLNYALIRAAGATNASLVMFLMPPIAVGFGALLFGERLGLLAILGMAAAGVGCLLIAGSRRPTARARARLDT